MMEPMTIAACTFKYSYKKMVQNKSKSSFPVYMTSDVIRHFHLGANFEYFNVALSENAPQH